MHRTLVVRYELIKGKHRRTKVTRRNGGGCSCAHDEHNMIPHSNYTPLSGTPVLEALPGIPYSVILAISMRYTASQGENMHTRRKLRALGKVPMH